MFTLWEPEFTELFRFAHGAQRWVPAMSYQPATLWLTSSESSLVPFCWEGPPSSAGASEQGWCTSSVRSRWASSLGFQEAWGHIFWLWFCWHLVQRTFGVWEWEVSEDYFPWAYCTCIVGAVEQFWIIYSRIPTWFYEAFVSEVLGLGTSWWPCLTKTVVCHSPPPAASLKFFVSLHCFWL